LKQLLENLNEQQLLAVKETEGYVRVIAGAGSGKTKALTSRYAYIVQGLGVSSSNVLCVTFTNKAAKEMKNRVRKLLNFDADLSYITTYHGFCVQVLREEYNKILFPKNFIIMDVEDQKTIIRQIYDELNLSFKDITFKQVIRFISKMKSETDYIDIILNNQLFDTNTELDKIFIEYLKKQNKNFSLDFDDLINYALYILERNPDVLEKWQKRMFYIQVDETQDSSAKQFLLVKLLSDYHKNLFVVGDPDQTIYEWRGAVPEVLVNFDQTYPDCKTIIMSQNYRSTPQILAAANTVIKENKIRIDKDLFTSNKNDVEITHFHGRSEFEESQWVVNEIKELIKHENVTLSDITLLYRANHVSRLFEQALIKENIPYSIFGGIRFFERKEIKDILAYLRLVVFGDNMSFLRIVNTPKRGLGKKTINAFTTEADKNNITYLDYLFQIVGNSETNKPQFVEFINLIKELRIKQSEMKISDFINYTLEKSGLNQLLKTDGDEERLENVNELINSIMLIENDDNENLNLEDYLQEIALYTDQDVKEDDKGRVKLMTIHTSKGLEFPFVFIIGFTDGIIPSSMSIKERRLRALEEERRLTYVAITRAEKRLYITESEGFNFMSGESKYPSRFLFEIKENLLIHKGEMKPMYLNEAKNHFAFEKLKLEGNDSKFSIGDIVKHPIWDEGKVISINALKGEYEIQFADNKTRPINFEYQYLELVNELIQSEVPEVCLLETEQSLTQSIVEEIMLSDDLTIDSKEKYEIHSLIRGDVTIEDHAELISKEVLDSFEKAAKTFILKNSNSVTDNSISTAEDNVNSVDELKIEI
jgi:DNA helicase-2/ATP-dependent DNA helicase PcrA